MTNMFRYIFLSLAIFLLGFRAFAQNVPPVSKMSDQQVKELMDYIETRGLSEAEVEIMAKARGYSDEDIKIVRERINRAKSGLNASSNTNNNTIAREQLGELSERIEKEVISDSTKIAEKKIFGDNIFKDRKLHFEPNLRIATSPDYILGVDDEFTVSISGYAVGEYNLKVSPEGTVRIENFSPIYVNGLTIRAAKEKIEQRLSSRYAGLRNGALSMDLSLTKVRSIRVTVVGDVSNPGGYTVSSLATLFNVLYLSGGPTRDGSFRNIKLLRNNKVVNQIDIYDFLLTGSLKGNVGLQDQDVIFVPTVDTWVDLEGEVVRPFRFELKPSESIKEVIKYAGGFTANAYKSQLRLIRNTNTEKEIFSINESDFPLTLVKNGDQIHIGAILERFANRVEVQGAVFRPGEYALGDEIRTVGDLIKASEGLREDAFKGRALIKRLGKNLDPQLISVNLDSVLRGYDIDLQREDFLVIKSITELREFRKVNISGKVNIPGEYDYVDNMSLNDLIVLAGGFREGASSQHIEVSRRINDMESTEKNVEIFNIDINGDFSTKDGNFILSPFDIVIVRELPNYQVQQLVKVTGEINYPGQYVVTNRQERISDLIERAGGLRKEAYLKGSAFYREGKQVAVNIEDVLSNSKSRAINLFIKEGDSLHIAREKQVVKVSGQVLNPTAVAFQENLSFRDYIAQAGGYNDSAFVRKTYVKYANGHVDRTRSFLTAKFYPKVERGMEIVVPVKRRERMSKAEVISISTGFVSLSAVLLTLFRLI